MICKECCIVMKSGTTYEWDDKNKRVISRWYDECPKCHFRKNINTPNYDELIVKMTRKSRSNKRK